MERCDVVWYEFGWNDMVVFGLVGVGVMWCGVV